MSDTNFLAKYLYRNEYEPGSITDDDREQLRVLAYPPKPESDEDIEEIGPETSDNPNEGDTTP